MFGLSSREARFVIVISAIHLSQHFFMRLIPPLIPVLAVAFDYPLWQLGLLVSLFSFGAGLFQTPFGIISDSYDRLYILPTGIVLMGIGYILFAFADTVGAYSPSLSIFGQLFTGSFLVMSLSMLIAGIGSAVVHPSSYPMITDNVSVGNKGKALGAFGSSAKFGDAIAPAVVGILILLLLWNQIMLILGLFGVVVGAIIFLILRQDEFETVPASERENTAGNTEVTPSIWETEKREYLYPLTIIYLFFITKNFSGEGIKTYLPVFVVVVYAYSFEAFGVYFAPESVANFYFALLLVFAGLFQLPIGGLADRIDKRIILICGALLGALGFLALSLLTLGPFMLFLAMCMAGAGIYGLAPARDGMISEISPPELEGRTFGYIWTAIMLSGSLMPPIVGYIMEVQGMRDGFLLLTIGTILSALFASLLFSPKLYIRNA